MITSENWNESDKLHGVYCYMHYRSQEEYLTALGYSGRYRKEGIQAFRKAPSVYKAMSKVFTDAEIDKLTLLVQ